MIFKKNTKYIVYSIFDVSVIVKLLKERNKSFSNIPK